MFRPGRSWDVTVKAERLTTLRRLSAATALLLLSVCATTPHYPRELGHEHNITYFEDAQSKQMEVVDLLTIARIDETELAFKLEITGTNLHSCEMEGVARRAGSSYEYRRALDVGPEVEGECVLRITPGRAYIVEDIGGKCRWEWCGVRASIGRLEFSDR
jgi:hypothetical protein